MEIWDWDTSGIKEHRFWDWKVREDPVSSFRVEFRKPTFGIYQKVRRPDRENKISQNCTSYLHGTIQLHRQKQQMQ